ncbi:MAG: cell division protein FtsQ/DivIB [Patescibacteria group bacterium]|jgi:cell division protein FtsQ
MGNNRQKNFDYYKKKLENPFYNKKKRITDFSGLKIKIEVTILIILAGIFIWLIYFSGIFYIKNLEISGLNKIKEGEVKNLAKEQIKKSKFRFDPQDNLLFFKTKDLAKSFQENYRFQEINLKKKWPNSLIMEIKEKTLTAVWLEDGKYYYLDSEGYVLGEADLLEIDGRKYPVIQNESTLKITAGKIALESSFITYAGELLQKIPELAIAMFSVNNEADSLTILLANGPKITFNTKDSIDKQLDRLVALKKEKMKDDFATKKYIDLRFGDKIYYQ